MCANKSIQLKKNKLFSNLRNIIVLLFLILVIAIFSFTIDGFFAEANFNNISRSIAVVGVIAAGMTLAMLSGGIDLSVGSIMAFSISLGGIFITHEWPLWLVYIVIIIAGILLGAINGFLISRLPVPALIITLGTMNLYRGITMLVTKGIWVTPIPMAYSKIVRGYNSLIILLLVFIICTLLTVYTRFGRNIYAIGGNEQAAIFSGVPVKRYKIYVYMIIGLLCALGGMLFMGRSGMIQPQIGAGYEMITIAAVVIGGTSVYGGEGSVPRTLVGTILTGVILAGLTMLNVNPYWQGAVTGGLIIIAISLDAIRKSRRKK